MVAAESRGRNVHAVPSTRSLPHPTVTGPSEICPNQETTFEATAGFSSYEWSRYSAADYALDEPWYRQVGDAASTLVDASTLARGYRVTVTDATGLTATSPLHRVEYLDAPDVSIQGVDRICAGESTTLRVRDDPGYSSYLWSTGETTPTITVSPAQTTNYTVTVTGDEPCPGISSRYTVGVKEVPEPVITGPHSLWPGQSATLGTVDTYSSYLWSTGETTPTITVTPTETTAYTVEVSSGGCRGTSVEHTVVVGAPSPRRAGGRTVPDTP
jgi:hypothetical protein